MGSFRQRAVASGGCGTSTQASSWRERGRKWLEWHVDCECFYLQMTET